MSTTIKRGLGRGLGALIPPPVRAAAVQAGVQQIDLAQIEPNPRQPRRQIAAPALNELAVSIREHGLLQPLLLTTAPAANGGARYQLIAGERRWRAAKIAGLHQVPAIVRGSTPQQMLELALVENIQRADLNPLEAAEAYRQLIEEFELTQEEVARRVGKDRTTVANMLRLLKLPDALKQALANEQISEGHARVLLQLSDPARQLAMLKVILTKSLSVRQTEEMVRRALATAPQSNGSKRASAPREQHSHTHALEEDLRRALGTKVELYRSHKGGKIIIEFYSDEELEAIYRKIVGRG